jgi:hypothetical protein
MIGDPRGYSHGNKRLASHGQAESKVASSR